MLEITKCIQVITIDFMIIALTQLLAVTNVMYGVRAICLLEIVNLTLALESHLTNINKKNMSQLQCFDIMENMLATLGRYFAVALLSSLEC